MWHTVWQWKRIRMVKRLLDGHRQQGTRRFFGCREGEKQREEGEEKEEEEEEGEEEEGEEEERAKRAREREDAQWDLKEEKSDFSFSQLLLHNWSSELMLRWHKQRCSLSVCTIIVYALCLLRLLVRSILFASLGTNHKTHRKAICKWLLLQCLLEYFSWSVHMNGQAKKQWIWEAEEKSHPKARIVRKMHQSMVNGLLF